MKVDLYISTSPNLKIILFLKIKNNIFKNNKNIFLQLKLKVNCINI